PDSGAYELDAAWSAVARASAAQAARANSAILAAVIRDLVSPLSDLLSLAAMAAPDSAQLPADSRAAIQLMQRKALLLHHRSENFQSAAAFWDGTFSLRRHRINVGDIISEVVQLAMPLVAEKEQRLEVVLQGESATISADPRRLAQVVINLLVNATEHSRRGAT